MAFTRWARRILGALVIGIAVAVLIAVGSMAINRPPEPTPDAAEAWRLVSLTVDGHVSMPIDGYLTTLFFRGDVIAGTAVCNGYSGRYELSVDNFRVLEGLATTAELCPADDQAFEELFVTAMMAMTRAMRERDRLEFAGDRVAAVFDKLPRLDVEPAFDHAWQLASGSVQEQPLPPSDGFLALGADGGIEYGTSCLTRRGTYVVQPDYIVVTRLRAVDDCDDPTSVDDAMSAAFERFRLSVVDGRLEIRAPGAIELMFTDR